jgi:hypothetical protein
MYPGKASSEALLQARREACGGQVKTVDDATRVKGQVQAAIAGALKVSTARRPALLLRT